MQRRTSRVLLVVIALVAVCGPLVGTHAQGPSATPHPIPTTPPGAIATRPPGPWVDPAPPPAGCAAETEPNGRPAEALTLSGEFCVSGTLVEDRDQDLYFYEVAPEDGLVSWEVTVRGVPATYTSIHFFRLVSPVGVTPVEMDVGGELARIDSDVWIGTPPGEGQIQLAPGGYLLGISRGLPGYKQDVTEDLGYWVDVRRGGTLAPTGDAEPNDDPGTATPVSGAFALSGDLQGTVDQYRWTLGPDDVATPWRLSVRSSIKAPTTLELTTADGGSIAYVRAGPDGVITLHDLGLTAAEYIIWLQYADGPQPYELRAEPVLDTDIDLEPNDTPEVAIAVDASTGTASGRLTTSADVDHFLVDVDAGLAAGIVDIAMSWADEGLRTLCLATDSGTRLACDDGRDEVAFRGLLLAQGRYLLTVSGDGGLDDRYRLAIGASSAPQPEREVEPNDDVATATAVTGAFAVGGDLIAGPDVFAWTIDEADAARTWHLDASGTPALGASMELLGPDGTWLAERSLGSEGTARIWDLRLAPGTYTLTLTPTTSDRPRYVLRATEETAPDLDPEPNDILSQTVPMDPLTLSALGRVATRTDVDRYRFEIDDAMATTLTEVTLTWPGSALRQVCLATDFGSPIQCASSRQGATLASLELAAGPYTIQVSGDADPNSRYEVRVAAAAAATPDAETEPNDRDDQADTWDTGLVMRGTSRDGDVDLYRVHVEPGQPMIWRLEFTGKDVETPEWRQPDGTHVGSVGVSADATLATIEDLYLVSGDHLLKVRGGDDYQLSLTLVGPPDLAAEHEPNDDADYAGLVAMGGERTGRLPVAGDVDVYRFSLSAPEHVVITAEPAVSGGGGLDISDAALDLEITSATTSLAHVPGPAGGGPTIFDGVLPQSDYEVWVRPTPPESGIGRTSDIDYDIRLERADPFVDPAAPSAAVLPAGLTLTPSTPEVAAYWRDGQRVDAVLQVDAGQEGPLELELDAALSHHAWSVEMPARVTVPASATTDVPLTIHAPPDAWRDVPVRITVRARAADGAQGTTFVDIVPRQDTPPVAPEPWWPIPAALLGGLDVASLALGAQPMGAGNYHIVEVHDGLIIAGTGFTQNFPPGGGPVDFDVDLAGDDPVPVAGTAIHPLGGAGRYSGRPRAFQLLLSLDGVTWTPVLSAEMGPQTLEQPFVLREPVEARFARLRVDSSWGGISGPVEIGEWKVVAPPGFAPSTWDLDLADLTRGGHVVWSQPPVQPAFEMLGTSDTNLRLMTLKAGEAQQLVIGFGDDRAAQITGLRWQDPTGSDPAARFAAAEVEVALESPLGPWQSLGTWRLDRAADGSVRAFDLPGPTWARFVRLRAIGSMDVESRWELPGKVWILERPTDDAYRSVLGQWGQSSARGIHEALVPARMEVAAHDADVGDTAEAASPLAAGEVANGRVARSADTDWYQLTVPADQNTLTITLATERPRDVRLRLYDPAGAKVPTTITPATGGITLTALVEPGASYHMELEQPILSVVFTFDTSASIKPWFPLVRTAIGSFAASVRPGLEAVQVYAFEEPDLLESWSDQAYLIQSAIDAWTTVGGSSALEASIKRAAVTLAERDGTRAVLAVGDAVSGGFLGGLPVTELGQVQPVIFPIHVGATDDPAVSTRIMQDLAIANGGYYQYATSLGEMERAFDRMATWLRRPAAYALSYETSLVEYPPGSIEVVAAEGAEVLIGGVAVELVLDTSGSMFAKLQGSTRIGVAKKSLVRLIDETLPEELPVALRIFKAGRRSCDTVLSVPLGPLDKAAMTRRIKRLKLHKGTRTPLGAAIAAVRDDIGSATGPRVVVVVTDGAETCDGDPAAAVQSLVDAGFDTTVNIVGFALDDEALKAQMASWAALGGGVFFDAQDQAGLSSAIASTLQAPFRVLDDEGTVVAGGVVGGPSVEVPVGAYRVEVLTDPLTSFETVVVTPGLGVRLTAGE